MTGVPRQKPDFTQRNRPRFMGPDSICFSVRRFFPDKLRSNKRGPITPCQKETSFLPSRLVGHWEHWEHSGPPEECAKQPSQMG